MKTARHSQPCPHYLFADCIKTADAAVKQALQQTENRYAEKAGRLFTLFIRPVARQHIKAGKAGSSDQENGSAPDKQHKFRLPACYNYKPRESL